MGTIQIIMVVLLSLNLLASAYLHGREKTGKYNFFITFFSLVLYLSLLIMGGFFK
jgi:hypothetical protein